MIYIQNDTNSIQIPKHQNTISTEFDLAIFGKMKSNTEYFEKLKNDSDLDLLYEFNNLNFSRLADGEYVYFLYGLPSSETDSMQLLETGLLQKGEYKNTNKQYEGQEKPTIQYK